MLYEFYIETGNGTEFINITWKVNQIINQSGVENGICLVYSPHTSASLTINENADPDVVTDLKNFITNAVPLENGYLHNEGNSAAHIKTSTFGATQQMIIINDGRLMLGTWQGIYFTEYDGPRTRVVYVKIIAG